MEAPVETVMLLFGENKALNPIFHRGLQSAMRKMEMNEFFLILVQCKTMDVFSDILGFLMGIFSLLQVHCGA